jgi:hypothetical protein
MSVDRQRHYTAARAALERCRRLIGALDDTAHISDTFDGLPAARCVQSCSANPCNVHPRLAARRARRAADPR